MRITQLPPDNMSCTRTSMHRCRNIPVHALKNVHSESELLAETGYLDVLNCHLHARVEYLCRAHLAGVGPPHDLPAPLHAREVVEPGDFHHPPPVLRGPFVDLQRQATAVRTIASSSTTTTNTKNAEHKTQHTRKIHTNRIRNPNAKKNKNETQRKRRTREGHKQRTTQNTNKKTQTYKHKQENTKPETEHTHKKTGSGNRQQSKQVTESFTRLLQPLQARFWGIKLLLRGAIVNRTKYC